MVIEDLLGDIPKSIFISDYYLRLPFSLPGRAAHFNHLGAWTTVESILAQGSADVMVSRAGRPWEGATPRSAAEARELYTAGHTITIRHAEKHHGGLAEFAAAFAEDFHAPIDLHLHCTPADHHGFGWHYDAEDVFILQTEGSKHYFLRKNTVNPWPLLETLSKNMGYEREIMPVVECTLEAGDWLYIPAGYWHVARAAQESLSIAVGLMSTAAIEGYDFLRRYLIQSLRWRQRLPTSGTASPLSSDELVQQYKLLFAELGEDLAKMLRDEELVRAFLAAKGSGKDQRTGSAPQPVPAPHRHQQNSQ